MTTDKTLPPLDIGPIRYHVLLPARSFANYAEANALFMKQVAGKSLRRGKFLGVLAWLAMVFGAVFAIRFFDLDAMLVVWSNTSDFYRQFTGLSVVVSILWIFVALPVLLLTVVFSRRRRRALRALHAAGNPKPHDLYIGDTGLIVADQTVLTAVQWPGVTGLMRGKNQWVLELRASAIITLPDETLAAMPQAPEMMDFIRQKMTQSANGL